MKKWLLACFFISGASALTYEIIWTRMLGWVFGTTIFAISTAVTAFMVGLAIGSFAGGRWMDRQRQILLVYSGIEIGCGVIGILMTWILPHLSPLSILLSRHLPESWTLALRFVLFFGILLIPTSLMGATLPTLARYLAGSDEDRGADPAKVISRITASLYGWNTFGGVVGALAADFFLIPKFGLSAVGTLAGLGNLFVAALILALRYAKGDRGVTPEPKSEEPPPRWLLLSFFLSGFCALAYEVLWTRVLVFFVGSEIFVFSIILAVFLSGIALGAWVCHSFITTHPRPLALLATAQGLLGVFGILSIVAIGTLEPILSAISKTPRFQFFSPFLQYMTVLAGSSIIVMLPATFIMGMTFPIYVRLGTRGWRTGESVGTLYAYNTIGSALGSLVAGFLLLPFLGLQRSLVLVAAINLVLAGQAVLKTPIPMLKKIATFALMLFILSAVGIAPKNYLLAHTYEKHYGPLLFFSEDIEGTVAVAKETDYNRMSFKRLVVNGFSMSGSDYTSQRYMRLLGFLPSWLHPSPHKALLIALGTGTTLSALAADPNISQIDSVDLSRSIRKAVPLFAEVNHQAWLDPRVHFVLDDGRHFLLSKDEKYDIITFEPPPPRNAGVVNLYTQDYYRICKAHLNAHGIVCQWLPVYQLSRADTRACIKAFINVFPYSTLWSGFANTNLCLIGSIDPLAINVESLRKKMANPTMVSDLHRMGLETPESVLSSFLKNDASLRKYTQEVQPLTDDHPELEYSFVSGPDIDEDWLFKKRDSVADLAIGTYNLKLLHQTKTFESLMEEFGAYYFKDASKAWQMELVGDRIVQIAPGNSYADYLLGTTNGALILLNEQLLKNQSNDEALLSRARWFRFHGKWNDAEKDYLAYARRHPESSYALFSVGVAEQFKGNSNEALQWYKAALQHKPDLQLRTELENRTRSVTPLQ